MRRVRVSAYSCHMAQTDCPICGGSGWKVVERTTEGAQPLAAAESAPTGSGVGEPKTVWAVHCDCTAVDRTDRAIARARIPQRYGMCDFLNFETHVVHRAMSPPQMEAWGKILQQAKVTVQGFARDFPTGGERGLLLMGDCGVGKTHLAVAALKEIIVRGHSGLFYNYDGLLKEIQDSYNPETKPSEMGVLDPILKSQILLLDDLGSSKPSMWALETIGHIVTTRYNEKRFTLITTNYLDPELRRIPKREGAPEAGPARGKEGPPADVSRSRKVIKLPSGELVAEYTEDTLEERVGKRIRSRLFEMCRTVNMVFGDWGASTDYRRRFDEPVEYAVAKHDDSRGASEG